MGPAELGERIAAIRSRITNTCQRRGRDPSTVTVVAVTKGVGAVMIREAVACGLTHLGENRIQEARAKQNVLGSGLGVLGKYPEPSTPNPEQIRWHLIGHLQRNKAKDAVELFDVVHSLDSMALAEDLERYAAKQQRTLDVFIQVNVSGEATKFGCTPHETPALAQTITDQPHLRLTGLMTMAPFTDAPETARPVFRQLRELRDSLSSHLTPHTSHLGLSMGMSQDFEVAIEEGADVVRIGTALFGTSS